MDYKNLSKEQLLEMFRNELETVSKFVEKVNEETDYNFQMLLTSAIVDESDKTMHGGKVIHGDIDTLRMLAFEGLTDFQNTLDEEENEVMELLEGIANLFEDMDDEDKGKGGKK